MTEDERVINDMAAQLRAGIRSELPEKDRQMADLLINIGVMFFVLLSRQAADLARIAGAIERLEQGAEADVTSFNPNPNPITGGEG